MRRDTRKTNFLLLIVLSLSMLLLSGCTGKGQNNSKVTYDIKKVTCTYNFGDQDGAEMDVYSSDLSVKKYILQPYSDSGVDLFAGEIPPEDKCVPEESAITAEDWNSLVDSINNNEFMDLPEELPEVEASDGSTCYITVETTTGTHKTGGYCAGNGTGKAHKRFGEVRTVIYSLKEK